MSKSLLSKTHYNNNNSLYCLNLVLMLLNFWLMFVGLGAHSSSLRGGHSIVFTSARLVSEWCDLWRMKLYALKTKTKIVWGSCTMYPQSPPLTIGRTVQSVLNESDDLDILGVIFDSKLTFMKQQCPSDVNIKVS